MRRTALKAGSHGKQNETRWEGGGGKKVGGKKKFALLMPDPLMEWFRDDELPPVN